MSKLKSAGSSTPARTAHTCVLITVYTAKSHKACFYISSFPAHFPSLS